MSELGQRLRQARAERNLTLEQLQNTTKIQKRYLEAIEAGKFDVMPGNFYARAFLKQYAEAVGLDPEQLFHEFATEIPRADDEVPERMTRIKREQKAVSTRGSKFLSFLPTILVIVLILAIALSFWFFNQNKPSNSGSVSEESGSGVGGYEEGITLPSQEEPEVEKPKVDENGAGSEEPVTPVPDEQETDEPATDEMQLEKINQTDGKTPLTTYKLTGTDKFEITLTANKPEGRSYIGVKSNKGKSYFAQELNKGLSKTFDLSSEEEVELNIGRTIDIDILVNGQPLPYAFPATENVHQKIMIQFVKK
ncbi:hypothetical protein BFG57_09855 [Bacillus solimangrovi]|uniref:HTH cro/C1-type domain-containing protein n=1 Tax=Bacillus solimangrovi TaxID=1305675 RepID=A0A1E5LJ77_9BACI|nr:hypothetical protein BFG57_09855 [Bacillus solimangrovi]